MFPEWSLSQIYRLAKGTSEKESVAWFSLLAVSLGTLTSTHVVPNHF